VGLPLDVTDVVKRLRVAVRIDCKEPSEYLGRLLTAAADLLERRFDPEAVQQLFTTVAEERAAAVKFLRDAANDERSSIPLREREILGLAAELIQEGVHRRLIDPSQPAPSMPFLVMVRRVVTEALCHQTGRPCGFPCNGSENCPKPGQYLLRWDGDKPVYSPLVASPDASPGGPT
jgi:hypothetical protein